MDGPDEMDDLVQREIDPHPGTAEYDLVEIVAELKGVRMDELSSLYTQVNDFVGMLFDEPPSARRRWNFRSRTRDTASR